MCSATEAARPLNRYGVPGNLRMGVTGGRVHASTEGVESAPKIGTPPHVMRPPERRCRRSETHARGPMRVPAVIERRWVRLTYRLLPVPRLSYRLLSA